MARETSTVSNTSADRAADLVRAYFATGKVGGDAGEAYDKALDAVLVIEDYRRMHAGPMARTTMGIRSMVRTVRGDDTIRPGQRFKRLDRILDKLMRYPKMRLSQMEDIGGCRVVLPSVEEVYAVLARVCRNWDDARVTDYIEKPKSDGYRGIHAVHRRDGRLIEVQLRTDGQHEWAEAIEIFGPRTGFNLKDGAGPADLRLYFKTAADRIAHREAGHAPDSAAEDAFASLREKVLPYFQRTT